MDSAPIDTNTVTTFNNQTNMSHVMPPAPPTATEELVVKPKSIKLGDGQFSYIKNVHERRMLSTCWSAVNMLEAWKFLRDFPKDESFMCSCDPLVYKIYEKIEELGYTGHSGCSFALTLRNIQTLARYGEDEFKKM
jgi:hypothetical protein